jgi:hypothetical protein
MVFVNSVNHPSVAIFCMVRRSNYGQNQTFVLQRVRRLPLAPAPEKINKSRHKSAPGPLLDSALDGYQTTFNNQQHVNYIGTDGHVHELVFSDHWGHTDLTNAAGAPNAAQGSALDGYQTTFNNQQHVNYIGTDGHGSGGFRLPRGAPHKGLATLISRMRWRMSKGILGRPLRGGDLQRQ